MYAMNTMIPQTAFSEKVCFFSNDYLKYCLLLIGSEGTEVFTQKLFSELIAHSQILENFLDFHGAKNNKDWYLYRELSAAVRHLSLGGYSQKHILNRLSSYNLDGTDKFREEGKKTLDFITKSLKRMAPVILDEAKRLQIAIPETGFSPSEFPSMLSPDRLENNIHDEQKLEQKRHIVTIASEFLTIAEYFDQYEFYEPYDLKRIRNIVPVNINEVEIRRYEMLVHNLQSMFDTYVIHGGYTQGQDKLKALRSHFSIVFHILQMMGRLLHFYERHLHDAGYKHTYQKVRNQLSFLVEPETLLDRTVNYGLFYTCHFLSKGKDLAREVLNQNIERGSIRVGVPVTRGFHCRPSILVAKIVQHYGGLVEMVVEDRRFDASSVLDLQWAGGMIQKEGLEKVVFDGDVRALRDIETLAGVNYGEDTMGNGIPLPKEIRYLRES